MEQILTDRYGTIHPVVMVVVGFVLFAILMGVGRILFLLPLRIYRLLTKKSVKRLKSYECMSFYFILKDYPCTRFNCFSLFGNETPFRPFRDRLNSGTFTPGMSFYWKFPTPHRDIIRIRQVGRVVEIEGQEFVLPEILSGYVYTVKHEGRPIL